MTKTQELVPVRRRLPTFVDFEGKSAIPAATMENAAIAIDALGIGCRLDLFHDRRLIGSHVLGSDHGQISDDACVAIRRMIRKQFGFDPGKNNTWDALNFACRQNAFNPVLDYLDSIKWDGKPRIDTWLIDYAGAPDTQFIRAVSAMTLIASVRRARKPGTKFDYITVLESAEGKNKSSAITALYGAENFSDQSILGLNSKELQETVRGRWGLECADLTGMRKAEIEKVKAQLSRQEDRARPAYGRATIDAPRSCVFWGSTNDSEYLRSQTGNRRFLPVPVGRIDVTRILADRDQLWAEASFTEDLGVSIMLPENLWAAAGLEQEKRTESDPWTDELAHVSARASKVGGADYMVTAEGEERISSRYLLTDVLSIPKDRQTPDHAKRVHNSMKKLGWAGPKNLKINRRQAKAYSRTLPDPAA